MITNDFKVLVVEDNPADSRLIEEVLKDAKIKLELHIVADGQEALEFLYKTGKYLNKPTPDMVLLDLNLPKRDGRDVLELIKCNKELKKIPVIVMTSSQSEEDIVRSYNLHANCYITKPIDLVQFMKIIRSLEDFWFNIVKLPPQTNN